MVVQPTSATVLSLDIVAADSWRRRSGLRLERKLGWVGLMKNNRNVLPCLLGIGG